MVVSCEEIYEMSSINHFRLGEYLDKIQGLTAIYSLDERNQFIVYYSEEDV